MQKYKRILLNFVLLLFLCGSLCGCESNENRESVDELEIEEHMLYKDEQSNAETGTSYDTDGDGFVDGWY